MVGFIELPPLLLTAKQGHDGEDADGSGKTWIAIVSGLSVGSQEAPADLKNQLLAEWLLGENGSAGDLQESDRIARLILAGNSLTSPVRGEDDKKPVSLSFVGNGQSLTGG